MYFEVLLNVNRLKIMIILSIEIFQKRSEIFLVPASARSYKLGAVGNNWLVGWFGGWLGGWMNGWLVGNAVFSETPLTIFLTFCIKLGDYKSRKVRKLNF